MRSLGNSESPETETDSRMSGTAFAMTNLFSAPNNKMSNIPIPFMFITSPLRQVR